MNNNECVEYFIQLDCGSKRRGVTLHLSAFVSKERSQTYGSGWHHSYTYSTQISQIYKYILQTMQPNTLTYPKKKLVT